MYTENDLSRFLDSNGIKYKIIKHGNSYRADEASRELGINISKIVKSVLFITSEGDAILAILRGDKRVDQRKLAKDLGTKKLRLASKDEVRRITGYEAGTLPPVGHKAKIKTLIDSSLSADEFVYAGGGSIGSSLRIMVKDIILLQNAIPFNSIYQ
ncbi:MAG: aminoacyl-tRNA deacylase [Nitrososphaeria archaeon]